MFGVFLDVTERKIAEESRELLAGEMSHRVKNLFAIASALTHIASRSSTTTVEMAHDITRRPHTLGQAHELIRPSLSKQKKALQLSELLAALLGAYDERGIVGDRICIEVSNTPYAIFLVQIALVPIDPTVVLAYQSIRSHHRRWLRAVRALRLFVDTPTSAAAAFSAVHAPLILTKHQLSDSIAPT